jgi:hypothetical protein
MVGGITCVAILAIIALWLFRRRRSSGEKPSSVDVPSGEGLCTFDRICCRERWGFTQALPDHVEPPNVTTAPSSAGVSGPGPQSTYSDDSLNRIWNSAIRQPSMISSSQQHYTQSSPSEGGLTYASNTAAQPRTGKAALTARQYRDMQQPVSVRGFWSQIQRERGSSWIVTIAKRGSSFIHAALIPPSFADSYLHSADFRYLTRTISRSGDPVTPFNCDTHTSWARNTLRYLST